MFVTFEARPGQRDALVDVLLEAADVVQALPDCLTYTVGTVADQDDAVCVVEFWTSEQAHADSLERDDVRAVIGSGMPLVAGMGSQVRIAPVTSPRS